MDKTNYGDYLQLHSGAKWDIENPTVSMVNILDIAHSLSKQCRFAGHIEGDDKFYSVAEHSVYVSHEVEKYYPHDYELQLLGLLHDATEMILVDVPRPIKKYLSGYHQLEAKTWKPIAQAFKLECFEDPLIETILNADNAVLLAEKAQIVPSKDPWEWAKGLPVADIKIQCMFPGEARLLFLDRFVELNNKRSLPQ
jgi:5'-nucleotidase